MSKTILCLSHPLNIPLTFSISFFLIASRNLNDYIFIWNYYIFYHNYIIENIDNLILLL